MLDRRTLILACAAFAARPARAAPIAYALEPDRSEVGFSYRLLGNRASGTMPVARAEISIDFSSLAATRADVTLDAARARAGFVFATDAMTGPEVLDVARFPTIRFRATRTRARNGGAVMEGDLTIRDVTRPVALAARFLRPPGADPAQNDRLSIELSGAISRAAFGATGFPDLVDDRIELQIRAGIRRLG